MSKEFLQGDFSRDIKKYSVVRCHRRIRLLAYLCDL